LYNINYQYIFAPYLKLTVYIIFKITIMEATLKTETKKVSVVYEVTFTEDVTNGNRTYVAGKAYQFRTQSPTAHHGDCFDAAWVAIHKLFGCIVKGSFTRILPASDPVIISAK
jgi:hypothetical protein